MSVRAEALAVESLIAWLRMKLPAKVAEVNLTRAAVLKAAKAGPYNISAGYALTLSTIGPDSSGTLCPLTAGAARTATQVAADINAAATPPETEVTASEDSDGRLVVAATTAPSSTTSLVALLGESGAAIGTAAVFGWDGGGERVVNAALTAPGHRNVMDGWPHQLDSTGGFLVVVGRRKSRPVANIRFDESIVTLELAIFRVAAQQENHRSREHISACLQCVREVLLTDTGRQLGNPPSGSNAQGIMLVELGDAVVEAMRFQPMKEGKPFGPAFDSAALTLFVKVYERPAAS